MTTQHAHSQSPPQTHTPNHKPATKMATNSRQLSQDIWALILQHVSLGERARLALVCETFRNAVGAVNTGVAMQPAPHRTPEQRQQVEEGVLQYLQRFGQYVHSLSLLWGGKTLAQLPCVPHLEWLSVRGAYVLQLGPSAPQHPGVLASFSTTLTSLELSSCWLAEDASLSHLSVLVRKALSLSCVDIERHAQQRVVRDRAPFPGAVLPCMSQLTRLSLSHMHVTDVHHVSALSSLCVLNLYIDRLRSRRLVELKPSRVAPEFVLPAAALRDLSLSGGSLVLSPAVLSGVVKLTRLSLGDVGFNDDDGRDPPGLDFVEGAGLPLFLRIGQMQELEELTFKHLGALDWPAPGNAAYTALTTSSNLRRLVVYQQWAAFPGGAWATAQPAGHTLPRLVHFDIRSEDIWEAEFVRRASVSSLVRMCPSLQHVGWYVSGWAAVAPLATLTALTSLDIKVRCAEESDVGEIARKVALLTDLQQLCLQIIPEHFLGELYDEDGEIVAIFGGSKLDLLPLTSLRTLTSLYVFVHGYDGNQTQRFDVRQVSC